MVLCFLPFFFRKQQIAIGTCTFWQNLIYFISIQDYEPTGTTPTRTEPDIPSNGTIESLRAMPMEALVEEFRENNSYESFEVKKINTSLIPRPPLSQINQGGRQTPYKMSLPLAFIIYFVINVSFFVCTFITQQYRGIVNKSILRI